MSRHPPHLEPLPMATMAIALGLSRALLPFLYLRRTAAFEHWHWFPMIFHLVHHISAAVGAVLFSASLRLKQSPAFLTTLAKTICLLLLATFQWVLDGVLASPPAMPSFVVPLLLFVPPLAIVGLADGLQQRMLLTEVVVNAAQRDDAPLAQQRNNIFTLLLLTSLGPFLSALVIETNTLITTAKRCYGICTLPIDFGIPITTIFVLFAFLQAIQLVPLWPTENEAAHASRAVDDVYEGNELETVYHYLPNLAKYAPPIWRLLLPLCALCAFSSALSNNFATVLFSVVPSNDDDDELPQERLNLIVFSASAICLRLALALCQGSALIQFTTKFENLMHTNALFAAGLFGAALAFCTLNVPSLRAVAVALFGASLALFWPTVLNVQHCLCAESASINSKCGPSSTILGMLISNEFGTLLFPLLYTQLLEMYGSPRLFNTVALFLIIAMVVSFVCLLNVQAEYKTTAKRDEFWGFWRGGRTRRSIRRLMRSVRTSIRRTPTGRNRQQRRLRPRVGTGSALLDESSADGGGISRSNYQSVQQDLNEQGEQQQKGHSTNMAPHKISVISAADDDDHRQQQQTK